MENQGSEVRAAIDRLANILQAVVLTASEIQQGAEAVAADTATLVSRLRESTDVLARVRQDEEERS